MQRSKLILENPTLERLNHKLETINKQITLQKKSIETSKSGGIVPLYLSEDILKSYEAEKIEIENQIAKFSTSSSVEQVEHKSASLHQKYVAGLKFFGAGLTILGLFAGYKALASSATSTLSMTKSLLP